MIFFIRLLPFGASLLVGYLFWYQRSQPVLYPWLVLLAVGLVPGAALAMSWGKVSRLDLLEKISPTFLLLAALAFALVLIEGVGALWLLVLLAVVSTYLTLELLFLMLYNPSAYPVNGLSRMNIAYVPLTVWYAISTSLGLTVFLHVNRLWHVALAAFLGGVLFRTTDHPGATWKQNTVWMLIGLLLGLEVGWIALRLPISFGMQGFIAALLLTGALRARRYLYAPKPSRRFAWGEGIAVSAVFLASLITARWL